jgi:predicted SAM-dependent methyltransferase
MIKLNLGCGTDIREGWINIDSYERSNGTVNMDITKLTYENNYADEICARDVLEHVTHRKTMDVLREWYRVLKPGGKIYSSTKYDGVGISFSIS